MALDNFGLLHDAKYSDKIFTNGSVAILKLIIRYGKKVFSIFKEMLIASLIKILDIMNKEQIIIIFIATYFKILNLLY